MHNIKKFSEFVYEHVDSSNFDEEEIDNIDSELSDENEEEEEDGFNEEYDKYDELLQGKNADKKKIGHNTFAIRLSDTAIAIRLYNTDLITFYLSGDMKVSNGGWTTMTTLARINEYLPYGYRMRRIKGADWLLETPNNNKIPFENGMIVKKGA